MSAAFKALSAGLRAFIVIGAVVLLLLMCGGGAILSNIVQGGRNAAALEAKPTAAALATAGTSAKQTAVVQSTAAAGAQASSAASAAPNAAASSAPASTAPASARSSAAPVSAAPSAAASTGAGNTGNTAGSCETATTAHWKRLEAMDPTFRSSGWEAWLKAAGVSWGNNTVEARQVEEEPSPACMYGSGPENTRLFASGIQVRGNGIVINWPNVVTTDRPGEITKTANTVQYQPDMRNPSILYTNVVLNGQGTVWISGFSWGQFVSRLGVVATTSASTPASAAPAAQSSTSSSAAPTACLTLDQLKGYNKDKEIIKELEDSGQLAGVQIKLTTDFNPPAGWVVQRNGARVDSAKAGETVSIWSLESCRPLKR